MSYPAIAPSQAPSGLTLLGLVADPFPNRSINWGMDSVAEKLGLDVHRLDYSGARYYWSNMGRFMSPDWAARPTTVPYAQFGDPQSLNLYSYLRNNPTNGVDPDGHDDQPCGTCATHNPSQTQPNTVITLPAVTGPVVMNPANQTATTTTSQSTAVITTDSNGNTTATVTTVSTSVTVSTAAVNNGQVMGGSTQTSTTTINAQGSSSTVNGPKTDLNAQQAQAVAGPGAMTAVNNALHPTSTLLQRAWDRKFTLGGTLMLGGVGVCALAEPCGAFVGTAGLVGGTVVGTGVTAWGVLTE